MEMACDKKETCFPPCPDKTTHYTKQGARKRSTIIMSRTREGWSNFREERKQGLIGRTQNIAQDEVDTTRVKQNIDSVRLRKWLRHALWVEKATVNWKRCLTFSGPVSRTYHFSRGSAYRVETFICHPLLLPSLRSGSIWHPLFQKFSVWIVFIRSTTTTLYAEQLHAVSVVLNTFSQIVFRCTPVLNCIQIYS